ncbi:MAG TPA: FGGY family carbohydrate kinase, partial [Anaerolineae bacterium]|nr:FGGY family carbohydrate kinase [Anaerolineae bacterium]
MSVSDQPYILALDEGTTNAKAILVNGAGSIVKEASRPVSITYPQPAWVEQEAGELWRA